MSMPKVKSYSLHENVTAQKYPAILAMTSLNDTRPMEPAAGGQARANIDGTCAAETDLTPVMVDQYRYERWKETALIRGWLLATADSDRRGGQGTTSMALRQHTVDRHSMREHWLEHAQHQRQRACTVSAMRVSAATGPRRPGASMHRRGDSKGRAQAARVKRWR